MSASFGPDRCGNSATLSLDKVVVGWPQLAAIFADAIQRIAYKGHINQHLRRFIRENASVAGALLNSLQLSQVPTKRS
jgi:hypothetical protein